MVDFRRFYGVRLYDLWEGGLDVTEALAMIERLPPHSCFAAELAKDEDYLASLDLDDKLHQVAAAPPMTEWTPEVDHLARIEDRLGDVLRAVVAGYSKKLPKVKPAPRPVSAVARAKQLRRQRSHQLVLEHVERARRRAGIRTDAGAGPRS